MTELDRLKKKLQELEKREQAVGVKENFMVSLFPVLKRISTKLGESTNDSGAKVIVKAIEQQTGKLRGENSKEVLKELKNLFKSVRNLEKGNSLDQKELNVVFRDGIEKIVNILVSRDVIPNETLYTRRNGKIVTVTENYDNFTLVHNWTYDNHGGLIKVITKRKNAT